MRLIGTWLVLACACGSPSEELPAGDHPPQERGPKMELPKVSGGGFGPYDATEPTAVVTRNGLTFDGREIVKIVDGAFDPKAVAGGAHGMEVEKLTALTREVLEAQAKQGKAGVRIALMFEPQLPYRTLVSTILSMKKGGAKRFDLIARERDREVAAPLTIPERAPASADMGTRQPGHDLAAQLTDIRNSPRSRLELAAPSVTPASSLTSDLIQSKVQTAYARGIERCVTRLVGTKTTGAQAIRVAFAVDRDGRGQRFKVTAPPLVQSCVEGLVPSWRFPRPKDADGEPLDVSVVLAIEVEAPLAGVKVDAGSSAGAQTLTMPDDARADPADVRIAPVDPDAPNAPALHPDDQPVELIVSVRRNDVLVWSTSGLEGTSMNPRKIIQIGPTAMTELDAVLSDIVKRRWAGRTRSAKDKSIILMADVGTRIQTVAELIGALRASADGKTELFPDVLLSTGFE